VGVAIRRNLRNTEVIPLLPRLNAVRREGIQGPLNGPALEIGEGDIRSAMTVFDRSLSWLRARLPNVPITIVYIPSALSVYHLTGASYRYSIEPRDEGKSAFATPAQIASNSDLLCSLVRGAAAARGAGFLDTRPGLRRAAATQVLHGPIDWVHFNAQGYRVLGELLAARSDAAIVDSCN
jgi:hypothetical protein